MIGSSNMSPPLLSEDWLVSIWGWCSSFSIYFLTSGEPRARRRSEVVYKTCKVNRHMTFCLACSSSFSRCSSCCSPNESICTKCCCSGAVLVHDLATVDVTCMASGLLSMLASAALLSFFFYAVNDHPGTQIFRLGSFNVSFKARQNEQLDLQLPVRKLWLVQQSWDDVYIFIENAKRWLRTTS
jgi:hypothetical protein